MRDSLGRLWKVGKPEGNKGPRFICYQKQGGGTRILEEVAADYWDQRHGSRTRKGGQTCNGEIYGLTGFQICAKCAAEVSG